MASSKCMQATSQRWPNRRIGILVIGEAGQGKSSLVNGLIGSQRAREGGSLKSVTKKAASFDLSRNGVDCTVWDTPGFGYESEEVEERFLNELGRECNANVDLILYCISMDSKRWPLQSDMNTFRKITDKFGTDVWRHCVFVLTFANKEVAKCPSGADVKQYFCAKISEFEDQIKQSLADGALSVCDQESMLRELEIRAVPVGNPHGGNWELPDREDWFVAFWKECFDKIDPQAQAPLLRINEHRLVLDVNSLNPPGGSLSCSIQAESGHMCLRSLPAVLRVDDDSGEEEEVIEMHKHKIPLHKILQERLVRDNSAGLLEYIKTFASERKRESTFLAGIGGIFEGLYAWIGHHFEKSE